MTSSSKKDDRNDYRCHDNTDRNVESGRGEELISSTRASIIRSKIPTLGASAKKRSSSCASNSVATRSSIPLPGQVFSPTTPQRRDSEASKKFTPRKSGSAVVKDTTLIGAPVVNPPGSSPPNDRSSMTDVSAENRASTSSIPPPGSIFGGNASSKGKGASTGANFKPIMGVCKPRIDVYGDDDASVGEEDSDDKLSKNGDVDNSRTTKTTMGGTPADSDAPVVSSNGDRLNEGRKSEEPHMFASMVTKSLLCFRGRNIEFYSEEMASMYESIAGEYRRGSNDEESRRASLLAYTTSTRIRRYLNRHENQPPISEAMIELIRTGDFPHEQNIEFKREEKILQGEIDQMSRFLYGILKQDDEILLVDDNEAVQDYHDKINQSVALEIYGQAKFKEGNYEEAKEAYRLAIRMELAYFGSKTPSLARLKGNLSRIPGVEHDEKEDYLRHFVASKGGDEGVKQKSSKIQRYEDHEDESNHGHTIEDDSEHPGNVEKRPSDKLVQEAEEKEPLASLNSSISRILTEEDDEEENQIHQIDAEEDDTFHAESRDVSFLSDSPPSLHSMTSSSTSSSSAASLWLSAVPPRYHPLIWITIGFLLAHVPTLMDSVSIARHGIEWKLKEVAVGELALKSQGRNDSPLKLSNKQSSTS